MGFLMFRHPQAWAKMNALVSHKEVHEFDSPKQLAHTRRVGIFMLVAAAFSLWSLLFMNYLLSTEVGSRRAFGRFHRTAPTAEKHAGKPVFKFQISV
jgi:hypothetical protein